MLSIRRAATVLLMTITMSAGTASAGNVTEQVMETRWRPCFVDFVKRVENGARLGYRSGKYYPYPSAEGGMPTIGFGHKIRSWREHKDLRRGITREEAHALLVKDLDIAWQRAALVMKRDGVDINSLDVEQREMLIDFAFNGVLHEFRRFRKAVVEHDWCVVIDEHRRYYRSRGRKVPLTDRNVCFAHRYLVFPASRTMETVRGFLGIALHTVRTWTLSITTGFTEQQHQPQQITGAEDPSGSLRAVPFPVRPGERT